MFYGAFPPKRVLCRATLQGETDSKNAQAHTCSGEQSCRQSKGHGSSCSTERMKRKDAAK